MVRLLRVRHPSPVEWRVVSTGVDWAIAPVVGQRTFANHRMVWRTVLLSLVVVVEPGPLVMGLVVLVPVVVVATGVVVVPAMP